MLTLFLPCRRGSERVANKNTRPFADHPGGLLGVKLDQLEALTCLGIGDRIVLDTNDPLVLAQGAERQERWNGAAELVVRARPDALGLGTTTTDALIAYALATNPPTDPADDFAWTHVTSPLCDAPTYDRAIAAYRARDPERHDSLAATTPLQTFLWSDAGPLNYTPDPIRWPRTQDLACIHELNSALFIVPHALGVARADRIGARPLFFPLGKLASVDVDWEEDFALAEHLFRFVNAGPQAGDARKSALPS